MIGTAMMIAVIGQHQSVNQLDSMPWEVDRLENSALRVFGLTLEKTSIQEANQIFASFGKTQLQVKTDGSGNKTYQLINIYDELVFGGLIAQVILKYKAEPEELDAIYKSIASPQTKAGITLFSVNSDTEIKHLSSVIASITYIPSIDYNAQTIRQNFGQPATQSTVNDDLQLWEYPSMGLRIYIYNSGPDRFVYTALKQP